MRSGQAFHTRTFAAFKELIPPLNIQAGRFLCANRRAEQIPGTLVNDAEGFTEAGPIQSH